MHAVTDDDLGAVCHPTKPLLYNRFVDRIFARAFERAVGALPPGHAVELGTGRGRWLRRLRARGWRATGVDVAPAARPAVVASAARVPLVPACADLVLAVTVLQHIEDKAACLDEMARLARPGGRVLLVELLDRANVAWQSHVMPRSAEWWRAELARRGLGIEREEPVEYLPLVQLIESRRRAATAQAPATMRPGSAKKMLWLPITFLSMICEPFAPLLGVPATHRLFLCRKEK